MSSISGSIHDSLLGWSFFPFVVADTIDHRQNFREIHEVIKGFKFIPIVGVLEFSDRCTVVADERQLVSELGIGVKPKTISGLTVYETTRLEFEDIIDSKKFAVYSFFLKGIYLPPETPVAPVFIPENSMLPKRRKPLDYVREVSGDNAFVLLETFERGWKVSASHGISNLSKIVHSPFFATHSANETFLLRKSSMAISSNSLLQFLADLIPAKIWIYDGKQLISFINPFQSPSKIHQPTRLNCVWRISYAEICSLLKIGPKSRVDICVGNSVFTQIPSGSVYSWLSVLLVRDSATRNCATITLSNEGVSVDRVNPTPAYIAQYNRCLRDCVGSLKMASVAVSLSSD